MTRFLQPVYLPILALFVAILINKFGAGNDKAPFLVLGAAIVSIVMGIIYLLTLRPLKAMIAFAPAGGVLMLFVLSRLGLIDLMPILGFR